MPYNKSSIRVCGNCSTQFHPTFNTNHCENCRRVTKNCAQCGKSFSVPRSHNRVTFCSCLCAAKDRWKNVEQERAKRRPPCNNCGKAITKKGWEYSIKRKHVFCSMKCYREWLPGNGVGGANHPRWTGGYDGYYGRSWKRQRALARKRDGVCQRCGKTPEENGKALDVHHIKPFRDFGIEREKEAHHLSNLICYCSNCHSVLEWELFQG